MRCGIIAVALVLCLAFYQSLAHPIGQSKVVNAVQEDNSFIAKSLAKRDLATFKKSAIYIAKTLLYVHGAVTSAIRLRDAWYNFRGSLRKLKKLKEE